MKVSLLLSIFVLGLGMTAASWAASNDGVIARMTAAGSLNDAQARDQYNLVLSSIKEELKAGSSVGLTGLGKFTVTERAERTGRNPRNGKQLKIPARRYVHFSSADTFKKELNPNSKSVEVEEPAKESTDEVAAAQ